MAIMKRLYADEIRVKAHVGEHLRRAVEEAFELSEKLSTKIILEFNAKEIICDYRKGTVDFAIATYMPKDS